VRHRRGRIYQSVVSFILVVVAGGVGLAIAAPHGGAPFHPRAAPAVAGALDAAVTATDGRPPAARRAGPSGPVIAAVRAPSSAPAPTAPWIHAAELGSRVQEIADQTGAQVGVAVRPLAGTRVVLAGSLQDSSAWSTMKVPVIMARYQLAAAQHESSASFDADVVSAITESDNAAVQTLFDQIAASQGGVVGASEYVQNVLAQAGDTDTTVNSVPPPGGFSTFGQTQWTLTDGTLFYRALANGCLPPHVGAARVLQLMGEIEAAESWGLGQTAFPGVSRVFFKGGWGPAPPDGPYTVRQFGIIETPSGHGFIVGIMAIAGDGTFTSGVEVLDELASAVAASTDARQAPAPDGC
jgi:hypothetical protein